ncbi:hypothetical protein FCV25MIE_21090 [Fagus crenata]
MVLPEASGKKVTERTLSIDSSNIACHDKICTAGDNLQAVAEQKKFNIEERELLNILPKFKLYHNVLPTSHATWRGGFLVSAPATAKFYGGFKAQPPPSICRKAFVFSQTMPLVLQVKLLPRSQVWADLFQNDCPDLNDVALYFSPDKNIERSKENSACLFELMEVQNSMMKSCINDVELLIFTSKQLHVDSQNVIASLEAEYYFWGVFRPVKSNQTLDKVGEEPSPFISSLERAPYDHASMDESEAIDMEIDMVDGENVGRVDVVVSRDASKRLCGIP